MFNQTHFIFDSPIGFVQILNNAPREIIDVDYVDITDQLETQKQISDTIVEEIEAEELN